MILFVEKSCVVDSTNAWNLVILATVHLASCQVTILNNVIEILEYCSLGSGAVHSILTLALLCKNVTGANEQHYNKRDMTASCIKIHTSVKANHFVDQLENVAKRFSL